MKLVIVESPSKAKKIKGFLGAGWRVEATRGHLRDLPDTELGVTVEQDFDPQYVVLPGKGNLVKRLVKAVHEADEVYLATDPDREGEAIAWHLLQLAGGLKDKPVFRATFNAITERAVHDALANPGSLDTDLVEAQGTRRVVDRLVGYLVSPLVCRALNGRLSAGRVQSVALRLVVEREREIDQFTPQTYYTLRALLEADGAAFEAHLYRRKDTEVRFAAREQGSKLVGLLRDATLQVGKVAHNLKSRRPLPPFTTSTLQQAANKGLGLSPDRTMSLAQTLYEAGLITYHRTDAVYVAPEAQAAARTVIEREYGLDYLPPTPPTYTTTARHAQAAHEALRPTDVSHLPDDRGGDGAQLYALIWRRFIASQMAPARYAVTGALIQASRTAGKVLPLVFRAQGRKLLFDGFLRVYEEPADIGSEDTAESDVLPALSEGQTLRLVDLPLSDKQTRAPSRFSEAALIQQLEALGIGRPSTFATMVKVIQHS